MATVSKTLHINHSVKTYLIRLYKEMLLKNTIKKGSQRLIAASP